MTPDAATLNDTTLTNALLAVTAFAQSGLLQALHALGLAPAVGGQPAWPFGWRVAFETLLIDRGLARQFALALLAGAAALLLALVGAAWRRGRWPAWLGAALLAMLAPWPAPNLVLTDAVPSSFHRSPTRFDAGSIERGLALYDRHCVACHGSDGRGEGPAAAALAVWPPTLSAGLLWKRPEGELWWRVLHGTTGRAGETTMQGFATVLSETDAWAVLDAMKAISAGDSARRESNWQWPVRAPEIDVQCDGAAGLRRLVDWQGQRLRIVAHADGVPALAEDPRLVTIELDARGGAAASGSGAAPAAAAAHGGAAASGGGAAVPRPRAAAPASDGCRAASPAAWRAYAAVVGIGADALAGTQFIVDRAGWLRALARPGEPNWSEENLICKSEAPRSLDASIPADGLGALIARMDAEPIGATRFGIPHSR